MKQTQEQWVYQNGQRKDHNFTALPKTKQNKKCRITGVGGELFFLEKIKAANYPISNYHPWKHT